jgi:hypothetical protein
MCCNYGHLKQDKADLLYSEAFIYGLLSDVTAGCNQLKNRSCNTSGALHKCQEFDNEFGPRQPLRVPVFCEHADRILPLERPEIKWPTEPAVGCDRARRHFSPEAAPRHTRGPARNWQPNTPQEVSRSRWL